MLSDRSPDLSYANIFPSGRYSRTSINGDLSTTVTSVQLPFFLGGQLKR